MNNMKATYTNVLGLSLVGLVSLMGCRPDNPAVHGEDFPNEDMVNPVTKMAETQAYAGARSDATLYPIHFDCGKLNSLGEAKLDRMMHDDETCTPMVVHLNSADDLADARGKSVTIYLKDKGLKDNQIKIESGINSATNHMVAPSLERLPKTENGDLKDAGGGSSASAGGAAGSMTGK
jgi:hypothetical protein